MTFAVLRALHAIIGDALDDIERVYACNTTVAMASDSQTTLVDPAPYSPSLLFTKDPTYKKGHKSTFSGSNLSAYASPPPSPGMPNRPYASGESPLDFPSLETPYDPTSPSEGLTSHPTVVVAINRILAATGQMKATVQTPFLTICDATMGYHLPSCMRILEASNTVEILREAGPAGLHVKDISGLNGVEESKLAHILRLLATHHIMREVAPDVFALNRISSMVDSGKPFQYLKEMEENGSPEKKYDDTNGVSAFVGLCTDEIFKASAYLTETYLLAPSKETRAGQEPTQAPFCHAFDTAKSGTGYFGWLEGEAGVDFDKAGGRASMDFAVKATSGNPNRFRLERFGKAMSGTGSWEPPGAVLNGFDWQSLPSGSTVVDVGGGIGSTSMLLASVSEDVGLGLKFVIQDRSVVVEMGEKAWRAKCPELLDSGTAVFKEHDFFTPQPIKDAAVFLLRVILHDWPDDFARRILLQLREAATADTKLVIADWVLPLACPDDTGGSGGLEGVEGAESSLAPEPLLPNLGTASANAYWMDLTMQVMFNAQERTLREMVTLALSGGWKIVKVTKVEGSLFGYIVAVPIDIPSQWEHTVAAEPSLPTSEAQTKPNEENISAEFHTDKSIVEHGLTPKVTVGRKRSDSRCDTFGTKTELTSFEETLAKFGESVLRTRKASTSKSGLPRPTVALPSPIKKKRPSPLSVPPPLPLSSPHFSNPRLSPESQPSTVNSPASSSHLHYSLSQQFKSPLSPGRQPSTSPTLQTHAHLPLSPRSSYSQLSRSARNQAPSSPSFIPIRQLHDSTLFPRDSSPNLRGLSRSSSYAHLPHSSHRRRSIGKPYIHDGGIANADLFDDIEGRENESSCRASPSPPDSPGIQAGTRVLNAAARIERNLIS